MTRLNSDYSIEELQKSVEDLIFFNDVVELKKKSREIQKILKSPTLEKGDKRKLEVLLDQCLLMSMQMQTQSTVERLLSQSILLASKIKNLDWHEKMQGFMLRIPVLEERDIAKNKFIAALSSNKEQVSDKTNLKTIGDWISLYNERVRSSEDRSLEFVNLTNMREFSQLDDSIKQTLSELFKLINYLHLSSAKMESDTETVLIDGGIPGEILDYTGGEVSVVKFSDTSSVETKKPNDNNSSSRAGDVPKENDEAVYNEESRSVDNETRPTVAVSKIGSSRIMMPDINKELRKLSGSHTDRSTFSQLHQALLQRNAITCLVNLRLLAEQGKLSQILQQASFAQMLVAKYRKNTNKEAEVSFLRSPNELIHFRDFLRLVLVDRLKLSDVDAAHIASELVGIARDKGDTLEHVAYFDESNQSYSWV